MPSSPFGCCDTPTVDFLGLPLVALDERECAAWMSRLADQPDKPVLISYLNAASVQLARSSPEFLTTLEAFGPSIADGQSVVWAARYLGAPVPQRLNVTDIVGTVLTEMRARGHSVAAIGGRPGEAERFATAMTESIPGLDIVLTAPGYLDQAEEERTVAAVRSADPDLVLMGMGAPLQEQRAERWSNGDKPRLWWCVGAVFEYFAGTQPRAPVWMRRSGLEWLFRLAHDPRRLARRYLIGNPSFVYQTARRQPIGPGRAPGEL